MKKIYKGDRSSKLHLPPGYNVGAFTIKEVKLENIVDRIWGSNTALNIKDTPHFKYLLGDKEPLRQYFLSCKGHTWARKGSSSENMSVDDLLLEFHDIINSNYDYLQPPYDNHYIIVRSNWHCIDGLRRACVLLSNGIETAPVAWVG
jgi:hypothetical protein